MPFLNKYRKQLLVLFGVALITIFFPKFLTQNEIACGDLLSQYAEKPVGLEFVSCEKVDNSQVSLRATYSVPEENHEEIAEELMTKYGMGELKFVCCGYETGGKSGQVELDGIDGYGPYNLLQVDMYSVEPDEPNELWDVDKFIVTAEIVEV